MHNNISEAGSSLTQLKRSNMANAGHWQAQPCADDAKAFIARYREIHETQASGALSELARLRGLIDDASARLLASFDVIKAYSERCRESMPEVDDANVSDVEKAVGNAISALQFHDMVGQLVGHAAQRIALLERITQSLGRLPGASVEELTSALAETDCGQRDAPVEQVCMAGGSVELF